MNKLALKDTRDRTFANILKCQAEQAGDTQFLITDDYRVSFGEAEDLTSRLAAGLQSLGVERGDIVALFMHSSIEMVLLALAVNKLGAIWSPINTEYKGTWLLDTIVDCQAKALISDEVLASRIADIQGQINIPAMVVLGDLKKTTIEGACSYDSLLRHEPLDVDYDALDYGDTCAILWTSGTTGKSKGVMQSYNAWIRAIVNGASPQYNSEEGDSIYCVLPLYNSGAWITSTYRALIEGIPCVIEKKFSVKNFWDRIKKFGTTQTFAIGAMGVFLMNTPEKPDEADNPLKKCSIVPLPPHLWQPFQDRFGVSLIRTGLGMSECLLVIGQTEDRDDVPVYALGFPPDDIEVKLCDDEGNEVPDGEPGEICVKPLAPYVLFNGYHNNPQANESSYRGDWFLTGDVARKDTNTGAYFYVDRKKDAVRYGGRNISTLEVESVVHRHPAVQDVAAFGIPSKEVDSEDELKISIILKEGQQASHEDICRFINDNAPYFFVPRYMEFVQSLPYTPTNKVQKFVLREAGVGENTWDLKSSSYKVRR